MGGGMSATRPALNVGLMVPANNTTMEVELPASTVQSRWRGNISPRATSISSPMAAPRLASFPARQAMPNSPPC
jgi:hypothetical protein